MYVIIYGYCLVLCIIIHGPTPCAGAAGPSVRGAGGPSAEGPLREGLAHEEGVGPGPGPAHEGINSYSAQEGINSKGRQYNWYTTSYFTRIHTSLSISDLIKYISIYICIYTHLHISLSISVCCIYIYLYLISWRHAEWQWLDINCFKALCTKYCLLSPSTCYNAFGTQPLIPSTWYQVVCSSFLDSTMTEYQVLVSKPLSARIRSYVLLNHAQLNNQYDIMCVYFWLGFIFFFGGSERGQGYIIL